ncbi:hypothetical protein [Bdellovibrio sp. HCB2-146]|uniref:hypothetical protein n=1 Tax=Bdellovibrio sp. HCB2-146 TaxID=3394362 RepID=UPI0039BC239B
MIRSFFVFISLFITSLTLSAQTQQTQLPPVLKNPYATTITAVLLGPDEDDFTRGEVTVIPGRQNVAYVEGLAKYKFNYLLQKNKRAPLVFVLPGTGGTAESGAALMVAEKMYRMGYSAVTLDNPFSWGFAVAASRSGLPGYTPRDSEDLYLAMQKVTRSLQVTEDLRPSSYSLIGYSLGALQSMFLQKIDDQSVRKFSFKKVLLINPPANLLYSVQSLDRMGDLANVLTPQHKKAIMFRVFNIGGRYLDNLDQLKGVKGLQQIFAELRLKNQEMAYLIGDSFRSGVRDVIYASQQVHDLGILKSPISSNRRNQRIEEASRYSFVNYIESFLLPQLQASKGLNYTIEDLNEDSSIYQFGDYIQGHDNIYLIHSQDDLIIQGNQDVAWFQEQFGDRALIFPIGGHCGAMNFPQFAEQLKNIFGKR